MGAIVSPELATSWRKPGWGHARDSAETLGRASEGLRRVDVQSCLRAGGSKRRPHRGMLGLLRQQRARSNGSRTQVVDELRRRRADALRVSRAGTFQSARATSTAHNAQAVKAAGRLHSQMSADTQAIGKRRIDDPRGCARSRINRARSEFVGSSNEGMPYEEAERSLSCPRRKWMPVIKAEGLNRPRPPRWILEV